MHFNACAPDTVADRGLMRACVCMCLPVRAIEPTYVASFLNIQLRHDSQTSNSHHLDPVILEEIGQWTLFKGKKSTMASLRVPAFFFRD
jgi:hypothetical protein